MKSILKFILIAGLVFSFSVIGQQHKLYQDGTPIDIAATVDKELRVMFPEPVKKAVHEKDGRAWIHSLISNTLYLTPKRVFSERLLFQGIESARMYVVDMSASETSTEGTVKIHLSPEKSQNRSLEKRKGASEVVTPIDMVQYAAQTLYSPDESLIEGVAGIRRVKVDKNKLDRSFYRGGDYLARPYSSWSASGVYVTAVEMENVRSVPLKWSVCNVRGRYLSVAPHAGTETPIINPGEALMFYFVSDEPFSSASERKGVPCLR